MIAELHSRVDDAEVVSAQIGRPPREPWRVAARCRHGFPLAIVSPPLLSDGERFPTFSWLTCPWLAEECSALESSGAAARWAARAAADAALADDLRAADEAVRAARAREAAGADPCAGVGIAGQRDPLGVKCLHAHVALELAGIADPIGQSVLAGLPADCGDARCARITAGEAEE